MTKTEGVPKTQTLLNSAKLSSNIDVSKIFNTKEVLLYLILNHTPDLLGNSSTGSDDIANLRCHFLLPAAACTPRNAKQSINFNFEPF